MIRFASGDQPRSTWTPRRPTRRRIPEVGPRSATRSRASRRGRRPGPGSRGVADGADRLAGSETPARTPTALSWSAADRDRRRRRQDEPVVPAGVGVADDRSTSRVDPCRGGRRPARRGFGGQRSTRHPLAHRRPRLGRLDLLDALVGDQDGDPLALQLDRRCEPPFIAPFSFAMTPASDPIRPVPCGAGADPGLPTDHATQEGAARCRHGAWKKAANGTVSTRRSKRARRKRVARRNAPRRSRRAR